MRMHELQSFGMQVKPLCRLSVERVTHNGAVQAVGMGAMYAELVGAAGFGVEGNEGFGLGSVIPRRLNIPLAPFVRGIDDFIAGNSRLAVLEIHHLQGTVIEIGTEGEADETFRCYLRYAFEQGHVALLDGAVLELLLEQGMGVLVLGGKE